MPTSRTMTCLDVLANGRSRRRFSIAIIDTGCVARIGSLTQRTHSPYTFTLFCTLHFFVLTQPYKCQVLCSFTCTYNKDVMSLCTCFATAFICKVMQQVILQCQRSHAQRRALGRHRQPGLAGGQDHGHHRRRRRVRPLRLADHPHGRLWRES